jgi:hypothetical protein
LRRDELWVSYLGGKVEVLSEVVNTFGGKDVLRRWIKKEREKLVRKFEC